MTISIAFKIPSSGLSFLMSGVAGNHEIVRSRRGESQ
jgi:hypothetical protein